MILKTIQLNNFRNFAKTQFEFDQYLTVIIGENARGKTNLLEAIYMIVNGSGFRETKEEELINFIKNDMGIRAEFTEENRYSNFEIYLRKKEAWLEKNYFFNKVKKSFWQYLKEVPRVVLFTPEQISIINGAPEKRRTYFDKLISNYDLIYKNKLINYESALRKRNKLLEIYQDSMRLKEELSFWDNYLVEQSAYLTSARQKYIDFLNQYQKVDSKKFNIRYLANPFTFSRLKEVELLEKKIRKTLIGPQKDNYEIDLVEETYTKNLHHYGSRSEQRLAVFWLKLNEIRYLEKETNTSPILLLDDAFSELDLKNKKLLLDLIQKYQTILTTTEENLLTLTQIKKTLIRL
jgi:DNA replication and repair protein RecF